MSYRTYKNDRILPIAPHSTQSRCNTNHGFKLYVRQTSSVTRILHWLSSRLGVLLISVVIGAMWVSYILWTVRFYLAVLQGFMEVSNSFSTCSLFDCVLVSCVQALYYYTHQNDTWRLKSLVSLSRLSAFLRHSFAAQIRLASLSYLIRYIKRWLHNAVCWALSSLEFTNQMDHSIRVCDIELGKPRHFVSGCSVSGISVLSHSTHFHRSKM